MNRVPPESSAFARKLLAELRALSAEERGHAARVTLMQLAQDAADHSAELLEKRNNAEAIAFAQHFFEGSAASAFRNDFADLAGALRDRFELAQRDLIALRDRWDNEPLHRAPIAFGVCAWLVEYSTTMFHVVAFHSDATAFLFQLLESLSERPASN